MIDEKTGLSATIRSKLQAVELAIEWPEVGHTEQED